MSHIAHYEVADEDYAKRVSVLYIASFANQPHEPAVMLREIAQYLLGKPKAVVAQVCNPECGAITKSDKPCIKSLVKWHDEWVGVKRPPLTFRRPIDDGPPLDPPEVREEAVKKWKRLKAGFAAQPERRVRLRRLPQYHNPQKLLEALNYAKATQEPDEV